MAVGRTVLAVIFSLLLLVAYVDGRPKPTTADHRSSSASSLCLAAIHQTLRQDFDPADKVLFDRIIEQHCSAVEVVRSPDGVIAEGPPPPDRLRREIYPPDTRVQVNDRLYRRHPFSSVTKISTGCSGGLLTPHHIITAAHCVHIEGNYSQSLRIGQPETLVEVQRRLGASLRPEASRFRSYYWHSTTNAQVPRAWEQQSSDVNANDFGLVTLHPDDCIVSSYMKLHPIPVAGLRSLTSLGNYVLHLTSFSDDKPPATLWYRHCGVAHVDSNGMIYFDCDTIFGSSGAPVYAYVSLGTDPETGQRILRRRIIAINSGNRNYRDSQGRTRRLNVATGVTPDRYREICSWAPEMCDMPDYRDRHESDSWMMTCGGPPVTTTTKPSTLPVEVTAITGTDMAGMHKQTAEEDGKQDEGESVSTTMSSSPTTTVAQPATTPFQSRRDRFLNLCAGLGRSLREECLRWAERTATK